MSRIRNVGVAVFAALLIASTVAPFVGVAGAVSGMTTIPDSNISENVPSGSSIPLDRTDFVDGGVQTTAHADTLELVLTTKSHADEVMGNDSIEIEGDGMALVLRDQQNHAGREVAIDAGALRDALGYVPKWVHGTGDDGDQWRRATSYEDGLLVFEVPGFSSNTITFESEVSVSATPAADGTSIQYGLSSTDGVSDLAINLTGEINTEYDNLSASGVGVDHTSSLSVGGNLQPTNGSGGDPELSVTGSVSSYLADPVNKRGDGTIDGETRFLGDDGSDNRVDSELKLRSPSGGTLTSLSVYVGGIVGSEYSTSVDVYLVQENPDTVYGEGTKITSGWSPTWNTGWQSIPIDNEKTIQQDTNYTIEFVTQSSDSDSNPDALQIDLDQAATTAWFSQHGFGPDERFPRYESSINASVSNLRVTDGSAISHTFGNLSDGETKTTTLNLDSSSSELNFSGTGAGTINYSLTIQERTQTVDPTIELNGHWTNHTGTLADGETVSLDTNSSWVQDGTNRINVSVGDGSLSADAPDPVVDLSYSHTAQDKQEVFYEAEQWFESYNVSKTFASDREQASLVVPYASEVVAIRDLAVEINNSGTWNAIDAADYSLSQTTLTVDLDQVYGGTIPTNTTIAVKTTGSRVDTHNVSITVVEPTLTSDELDSKIRIDSRSSGAYIDVGPTPEGERIHYTASETWTDPSEYVLIEAGGGQKLHVPGASAGDTFRVRHVATKASINSGDAKISVVDAGETPEFEVGPGPSGTGDTLELTYYNTESGTTYLLQAIVDDTKTLLDSGVAQSPVTLSMSDESRLVGIFEGASSSDSSSSGGGGGGSGGVSVGSSLFIVLSVMSLTGVWFVSQRFGSGRVSTRTYLALSGGVVLIFGLEVLSGALVSGLVSFLTSAVSALFGSLSTAWPILILVVGGLGVLWLRNRGKPQKKQNIIIRAIQRRRQ